MKVFRAIITGFVVSIFSGTTNAALIGDTVTLTGNTVQCVSDGFFAYGCNPASTTIGGGIEFDIAGLAPSYHWSLDIGANSLVFKDLSPGNVNGGIGKVYLTGFDSVISGISNFATDAWFGIDASDITFTSNSITIDATNSGWMPDQQLSFDITAIPEPATLTLAALGLAGIAARRRKNLT